MIDLIVDESEIELDVSEQFVEGGGGANLQPNKTVTPTASQVQYLPDSGYDGLEKFTVNAIPPEYIIPLGTKNIAANGNNQDVKTYEKVNVNVPNSYAASDEGKVVQSGALVSQSSQTVMENGTYDTTLKNQVVVEVQSTDTLGQLLKGELVDYSNDSVDAVKEFTFRNSQSIRDFRFANATLIHQNAFYISSLRSLFAPNALLGGSVFYGCANLLTVVSKGAYSGTEQFRKYSDVMQLHTVDFTAKGNTGLSLQMFKDCVNLQTIILREAVIYPCAASTFDGSSFASGGTGGTIYIPKSMYDHLGDGTSNDYKAATNWSTINGYGTITWAKIEGSIYETQYGDGTPIT